MPNTEKELFEAHQRDLRALYEPLEIRKERLRTTMLTAPEKAELLNLLQRVTQYVHSHNYRDFDAIAERFNELLERWESARDPHGTH